MVWRGSSSINRSSGASNGRSPSASRTGKSCARRRRAAARAPMAVEQITVDDNEANLRLDRWFKRRYPELPHGRLEKLLRTGQIRVDGGRAKANQRLEA